MSLMAKRTHVSCVENLENLKKFDYHASHKEDAEYLHLHIHVY